MRSKGGGENTENIEKDASAQADPGGGGLWLTSLNQQEIRKRVRNQPNAPRGKVLGGRLGLYGSSLKGTEN